MAKRSQMQFRGTGSRFTASWEIGPDDKGIALPAQVALEALPASLPLFHADYERRHPLAAYNVSISMVSARGKTVCDAVASAFPVGAGKTNKSAAIGVLEAQDAFLDSLIEHLEDCKGVLLCFSPKGENPHKAVIEAYERGVQPYRDHVGLLVNHIKHKQGRLCFTEMRSQRVVVPGYWLEQVKAGGEVGPHDQLHRSGHTAFSFFRDLRLHAVQVVAVSTNLARGVEAITLQPSNATRASQDPGILSFLQAVSALPAFVFPDEVVDPWPLVSAPKHRGRHSLRIRVECPSAGTPLSFSRGEFSSTARGDGVTRAFQFPYLGKKGWEESAERNPQMRGIITVPKDESATHSIAPPHPARTDSEKGV